MTRRRSLRGVTARPEGDRVMIVALQFLMDLQHWVQTDSRVMLRILRMMVEIQRDPLRGIGKPEPLKHDLGGFWSRRITDEDRLLYRLQGERIEFTDARWHYHR